MALRPPPYTIAAPAAARPILHAVSRGLDPGPLLAATGLTAGDLQDWDRRIPRATLYAVWEHVARALRDPGLPVRVGQTVRMEDLHVMGFAIATSRNARECLERLSRYIVLIAEGTRWQLDEAPGESHATIRKAIFSTFSLGERLEVECRVAVCLQCFRQAAGHDVTPTKVTFRHPAPRDVSVHNQFFGCPVEFGAPSDGFSFDRSLLEMTPRGADPALSAFFQRLAEELRCRTRTPGSLIDRVRDALAAELSSGEPQAATIARRLGMSERSLRRHLAQEGKRFRDVLDEVRCEVSKQLLRRPTLPLIDIAFVLGFSDVTTFTRAFKRWCGVPPGKYREGLPPS